MNNKSFTLIETLTAIVIIGLLAGFIIVKFQDSNIAAEISRGKAFSLSLLTSMPMETVSEWKFDGPTSAGSSATTDDVKDTWGRNDGIVSAESKPIIRDNNDCISGKCLEFDGTTGYIDTADISFIELADVTFSFWGKVNNTTKDHGFIYKGGHGTSQPLIIWFDMSVGSGDKGVGNTKALSVLTYDGSTQHWVATPTNSMNNTNWNHIVAVINKSDGKIEIYINGVLCESNTKTWNGISNTDTILRLGNPTTASSTFALDGFIDDVRIFNAALKASQINKTYLSGLNNLYLNNQISKEEYNQRLIELNNNLVKHE
ncbi:MAG: prepilin-type N-terminal cleavage/methylation domain-containing protein [Candidatus Pacebacteria bacterium]|nr:prepilin-type N-terminal cleavage/methylation domain-containing protein [Candidatus Paceibacterota bacterium]